MLVAPPAPFDALVRRVLLDLAGERGPRADKRHVASDDIPELRQLVEGKPAQHAPPPGGPVPPPRYGQGDETPTVRTPQPPKPPAKRRRLFGLLGIQDR